MKKYKVVLTILIFVFTISLTFLLVGCNEELLMEEKVDVEFPVDENGYPKNNIVLINNKSYPIQLVGDSQSNSEIKIKIEKKSDIVDIVLPRYLPINSWSIEEREYMSLISYNRINFPIKDKNMSEGISSELQRFKINVPMDENTEILFKWSNINEIDKVFNDKKEDYLLKIVISY